jgi:hypothetical protein
MNIAAYMAALDVWDVSPAAKHALQVLCGRADRYTGMARLSIGRVAADMGRNYSTARRALGELVDTGYVTVDKLPGLPHLWMLTSRVVHQVPSAPATTTSRMVHEDLVHWQRGKESLEKTKEAPSPRPRQAAGDGAGENLPAAAPALRLVNPGNCRRCLGTGWAVGPGGQSYQCHHREQL